MPPYAHVFVIVEENKHHAQVLGGKLAPNLSRLARDYGEATRFYGETHPSQPNYIALLGGDTFGIADNDPPFCRPGTHDRLCREHEERGYADHVTSCPHLGDQLTAIGMTWRAYLEDMPTDLRPPLPGRARIGAAFPTGLYAPKHAGFLNFRSVYGDGSKLHPALKGFEALDADLASGRLPHFALIIPNLCNDMHGEDGPHIAKDCQDWNTPGLIRRGDRMIGQMVAKIQATPAWRSKENVAIVITFDEDDGQDAPLKRPGYGGGRIPTVVVTNHGGRKAKDATLYNHYALLRTIENALGVAQHLRHAGDPDTKAMTSLFAVEGGKSGG